MNISAAGSQRKHHGKGDETEAEHEGSEEIDGSAHPYQSGDQRDGKQRGTPEKDLPRSAHTQRVDTRKHPVSCTLVIAAVHPRQRQEVRHLPEEENGEEYQSL